MVQNILFKINLEEITMSHLKFSTKKKQTKILTYFLQHYQLPLNYCEHLETYGVLHHLCRDLEIK